MTINYRVNPPLTNDELNRLYAASWPNHTATVDFRSELDHALAIVGAFQDTRLIGYVRLAWDGGIHAFLLEPTVHPDFRRRGIGRSLVGQAIDVARERGMMWVHVDFEPELQPFYDVCGFVPTKAGLIRLS